MSTLPKGSMPVSTSPVPITKQGYEKLKEELIKLKKEFNKLPAIIAHARSRGDLKENAEYHAARERQGMLNAHISKINSDISNSRVVEPSMLPKDLVTFGKKVTIENEASKEQSIFVIVGPAESAFHEKALSLASRLGKALLGKKKDQRVELKLDEETKYFRILSIETASFGRRC